MKILARCALWWVLCGSLGTILTGCVATGWHDDKGNAAGSADRSTGAPSTTGDKAASTTGSGDSTKTDSSARPSAGNPPFYEVFGKRYFVMPNSEGYREKGIASWYGEPFHGRRTSSGAVYDMYGLTAAHKTLPLPSMVRVTNLESGRSVVVTVNDRGPFVNDRIIDLSYAAAKELGMVDAGTCKVEVEVIAGLSSAAPVVLESINKNSQIASVAPASSSAESIVVPTPVPVERLFMQVGAFGDQTNASRLKAQLESNGVSNVVIRYDDGSNPAMYRVRIGPIEDSNEYDALASRVASLRIANPRLVTESSVPP
ncbi:MAG: septal ring lytic transglycosylase RlpA family protein [Gammaproteobacteria bacterium]